VIRRREARASDLSEGRNRDAFYQRSIQVDASRRDRDREPDAGNDGRCPGRPSHPRGLLHGTILARGPFTEDLDLKVKARIGGELGLIQVDDAADTIFQQITVSPGGFTGWHSHPGPAFVVVKEGTFTYYDGDERTCTGIEYGPGEAFVDLGQGHIHSAKNAGATDVVLYVVYLDVPPDEANPFIPADPPGFCNP